jgi:hypothetical protein
MARADRNNKKFHKWNKLSSSQDRCLKCGCIRTAFYENKNRLFKYQDNESKIHMEYLECIEEIDNSEFY